MRNEDSIGICRHLQNLEVINTLESYLGGSLKVNGRFAPQKCLDDNFIEISICLETNFCH